jgi:hypothetical protein
LSANFSGYKDYDLYGVFAPAHITFKLGNKVVLDLAVTEFHSNPYVVFPTPELLARAAQEKSRDR